jgi:hypothetical protein
VLALIAFGTMVTIAISSFFFSRAQENKEQRIELVASLVTYFEEKSLSYSLFLDAVKVKHGRKIKKLVEKALDANLKKWRDEKFLEMVSEMP